MTAHSPRDRSAPDDQAADAKLTEQASRLRLVVGRLHRRIRIDSGDSPLQVSALATIDQHGPLRLSELARREAVTAPTMSRVLTALDQRGLVARGAAPHDGRGVLITITDTGRIRLHEIRTHRTALVARRLQRFDATERAVLHAALPVLEALLEDD